MQEKYELTKIGVDLVDSETSDRLLNQTFAQIWLSQVGLHCNAFWVE